MESKVGAWSPSLIDSGFGNQTPTKIIIILIKL
jgi:hypothetical protein